MSEKNDGPEKICVRCFVAGRVQGVFYRASTRFEAQSLGLTGYSRNLADGRVEVLACGDPNAIERLKAWLRHGPQGAQVSGVACEVAEVREYAGFTVG